MWHHLDPKVKRVSNIYAQNLSPPTHHKPNTMPGESSPDLASIESNESFPTQLHHRWHEHLEVPFAVHSATMIIELRKYIDHLKPEFSQYRHRHCILIFLFIQQSAKEATMPADHISD